MMLADAVQIAEGKLYVLGGGVDVLRGPFGLAMLFHVAWDETNQPITFVVTLLNAEGQPMPQPTPISLSGTFEVGRPPNTPRGIELKQPIAVTFGPLSLSNGSYEFTVECDGKPISGGRLPFEWRAPNPQA